MIKDFLINQLQIAFGEKEYFSREELYNFFKIYEPDLKKATFGWRIYDLISKGIMTSIKKGFYSLNRKKDYKPYLKENTRKIVKILVKNYPNINYCIFDTECYNEFTIHQFSRSLIMIETQKDITESVYYSFKDSGLYNVFLNPNNQIMIKQVLDNDKQIIINPIISRSPIMTVDNFNVPRLEKMLIDLYCEPIIRTMYGESEMKQIFSFAYKHYFINYTTLKNYAKRRKRYEEINNFILNNIDSSINNLLL